MKKVQLNKTRREVLTDYVTTTVLPRVVDRSHEASLYDAMIAGANRAIRAKYPEAEMATLRKYNCTRHDRCLRFQFPSGRVDGFQFPYRDEERLADVPSGRGCMSSEAFAVDEDFEAAFNEHALVKKANDEAERKKAADYHALIQTAKTVDDILAVMPLPDTTLERLNVQRYALVAISPDVLERIKADFTEAA